MPARVPGYAYLRPTLLLVLIIGFSLFIQRQKFSGWTKEPIVKALFAFLIYAALALPLVEYPGSVLRANLSEFVKAIIFLFFTALIIDSERRLVVFLYVFVGCQVFRVLEPLYLHIVHGYWGQRNYIGDGEFAMRLSGAPSDVVNPNGLGFILVTAIPFLHYLLWPSGIKGRILYLILMPCLLYALILTSSRGAFLALLVVAFMIWKASSRKVLLLALGLLVGMAGWSIMEPQQKDRYLSIVGMSQTSNAASAEGRLRGMLNEFQVGMNRPVVGHGIGTTGEAKYNLGYGRQAAHNLYAQLLIETGVIGFVLFLRFLVKIYKQFRRNQIELKNNRDRVDLEFYRKLNNAMIAVFWMYIVYSTNYYGVSQYYWYLFGGVAIVYARLLSKRLDIKSETESTSLLRRRTHGLVSKVG
ncbi:O-antigen ligase family protein [Marinobacter gudaonensis]|nr:O-antigen ligase family protein [Marinobacter gudaonensis]